MNNEQKQRAQQILRRFEQANPMSRQADSAAVDMAALLQELVDAPEEIVPADLPTWENGDDPLVGGGLISRGVVDFASLGIWSGKPAPDVEPVAYVTGYNNGYPTIAPVNSALCMTIGTALYSAPPAPSLPDGWRDVLEAVRVFTGHDFAVNLRYRYGENWGEPLNALEKKLLAATPTPPEPPADVVRDAERYRWLTADHESPETRLDVHNIAASIRVRSYAATSAAIDAAIEQQGVE